MTKVKICGITNLTDALLSAKYGADALGFNFFKKSPRYILPEKAKEITEQIPENVLNVGVFVNEDLNTIAEIAKQVKLGAVQLHGEETSDFVKNLREKKIGFEIIKAFRVNKNFRPPEILDFKADAILLDAFSPQEYGGTGEIFDWEIAKNVLALYPKMYLAGGLSSANITQAISEVNPYGVDACSSLEIKKGRKDRKALIGFLKKSKIKNG